MLKERTVINDCYILQSSAGEDQLFEYWIATAIFSATKFLLRFLRDSDDADGRIAKFRDDAFRSYHVCGPLICDFVEIERWRDRVFISSEFHGERFLAQLFESGARWPLAQICRAVGSLADALRSFHSIGIAYGNLSAGSLVVSNHGSDKLVLKILKPGMLALVETGKTDTGNVDTGTWDETGAYLAPECKAGLPPDTRSDIFSLGVHLFRFMTGKLPCVDTHVPGSTGSLSLRYVACALMRRGISEALTGVVLKTLMADPETRYQDCIDFMRALEQALKADPETALFPLSVHGHSPGIPETTAYFGALEYELKRPADSNRDTLSGRLIHGIQTGTSRDSPTGFRLYPVSVDPAEEAEADDLRALAEEAGWTVDDYIAYARRSVHGLETSVPRMPLQGECSVERPVQRSVEQPVSNLSAPISAGAGAGESRIIETMQTSHEGMLNVENPLATVRPRVTGTAANPEISQLVSGDTAGGIARNWVRHRIREQDIMRIIELSALRARKGKGSFRFIQEPEKVYSGSGLFDMLESLSDRFLYVNAGSFERFGTADLDACIGMLEKALSREIAKESPGSRSYLARSIFSQAGHEALTGVRLAAVLSGTSTRGGVHVKSEIGNPRDRDIHLALIRAIRSLGRKSRPLILVIRGGESVTRNLHDFLAALAANIETAPISVFVFFRHTRVSSWHALHALSES